MRKLRWLILAVIAAAVILTVIPFPHGLSRISDHGSGEFERPVADAINVYCRKGTRPSVKYVSGTYEGVPYNVLEVKPDDHTFIQLDYAGETPEYLDELYDHSSEYWHVGGINGGFFQNSGEEYGRPVGALLIDGSWAQWKDQELTPAYGRGNATVYFNRDGNLKLAYHGWENGEWKPVSDSFWSYNEEIVDYGYQIDTEYGLSGAYTLLRNGKRVWLGKNDSAYWNRSSDSWVTLFGETSDGTVLLVIAGKLGGGEAETELMKQLGAVNAIRLDGNTSTCMTVDKGLVH